MSPLEARLALLERRIHRLRTTLIAVIAIGFTIVCLAARQAPDEPKELIVTRLTLVDDNKIARVVIGSDRPGLGRISPSTGITIHDATGAERFGVGVMEDNRVQMGFDAPADVGHPMRDRIGIGVGPNGAAYIALIDNDTGMPVRLITDATGGGGLEFIGYDKPNSKVIIKRQTFSGEKVEEVHHDFPPDSTVKDVEKKK